jgi:hypothetical protein
VFFGALFERVLATRLACAQHVQADAGDDGGEPATEVFDAACIRAAELKPRFLNGVVGFAQRAEHAVGDGAQMGSGSSRIVRPANRVPSSSHILPFCFVMVVTDETDPV